MTSKKLGRTITFGILALFLVSMAVIYIVSYNNERDYFKARISDVFNGNNIESKISYYNNNLLKDEDKSDTQAQKFLQYFSSELIYFKYPYVLAVQNPQGEMFFTSDNFMYFWGNLKSPVYIDIDEYLTDETRRKLSFYKGDFFNGRVNSFTLHYDGEKYIPVEIEFEAQGMWYGDGYFKQIKFTDYEPNFVIDGGDYTALRFCLKELNTEFFNKGFFHKMKEKTQTEYDNYNDYTPFGAVVPNFILDKGNIATGTFKLPIGEEEYSVYYACGNNLPIKTVTTDDFKALTVVLSILFAVTGFIFYSICMKVITKSEKLDEAKSTFISAASHELKTPLAVIQNQCECILENIAPEKNKEYLRSVYEEALRMDSIVTSLLSYNKLQQLTEVKKEACDLSELLRQEVRAYSNFAENSGVVIEESIEDKIFVDCNPQLMKMAIGNYLSNAIKYCIQDKKVEVKLSKHRNVFTLEVINSAERESVQAAQQSWSEFAKGDKSRQRSGASIGMGLPICKKIFELHSFRGYCKYNEGKVSFVIIG